MSDSISQKCLAGLDIGSHTTRLLIARKSGSELAVVRAERRVTRMAEGFDRAGAINEEAQRRNIEALKEYGAILRESCGVAISCGATGVVRRARNSGEVLGRIAAETGLACGVLSEESEAMLSAKGILSTIDPGGKTPLLFDVGGGSTEFVFLSAEGGVVCASRPVGAATLHQACLAGDPPGVEAVRLAERVAREQIDSAGEILYENLNKTGRIMPPGELMLAGTAGTVTTLAAMKLSMNRYSPYRVNGTVLSRDWLSGVVESLALMPLAERRKIAGLEPGREDVILGGAVIVSQILSCFGGDSLVVSDAGLLEGIVLALAERESGLPDRVASGPRTDLTWRRPNG